MDTRQSEVCVVKVAQVGPDSWCRYQPRKESPRSSLVVSGPLPGEAGSAGFRAPKLLVVSLHNVIFVRGDRTNHIRLPFCAPRPTFYPQSVCSYGSCLGLLNRCLKRGTEKWTLRYNSTWGKSFFDGKVVFNRNMQMEAHHFMYTVANV